MQIASNTSGFLSELFVSTGMAGYKSCVVVVKATFLVSADGECRVAEEQAPFVFTDAHHGDAGTTSIRYESDFAPVKPRADVLIDACVTAPGGRPVSRLEVSLSGPGFEKRVVVTGDRTWVDSLRGLVASAPRPFEAMPLVWERAFGGSDQSQSRPEHNGSELRNLVGVGFHLNVNKETIVGRPLPNIERPGELMQRWSDKPEPVGFSPLARGWLPRVRLAGTYDERWMDEELPFLPADFDELYFQAAPSDLQLPGLAPGAAFECTNMNKAGRFVVRLPVFHVPVRFAFDHEVRTLVAAADTLILQPGVGRVILVGRASVRLPRKFTALREIQVGARVSAVEKPRFKGLDAAVRALRSPK